MKLKKWVLLYFYEPRNVLCLDNDITHDMVSCVLFPLTFILLKYGPAAVDIVQDDMAMDHLI